MYEVKQVHSTKMKSGKVQDKTSDREKAPSKSSELYRWNNNRQGKEKRESRFPRSELRDYLWKELLRNTSKDVVNGLLMVRLLELLMQYKQQDAAATWKEDKGLPPPLAAIYSSD